MKWNNNTGRMDRGDEGAFVYGIIGREQNKNYHIKAK